jgi:drug/metabolite transporter (DMT)-like permease
MFDLFLLQLLFSTATPINKILLGHLAPLALTVWRLAISGSILTVFWLIIERPHMQFTFAHTSIFVKKIFFGTYLKYVLKYWGLQYLTSTHMVLLLYSTPLWTALYEYIHFGYVIRKRQWLGMLIACAGTAPLLLQIDNSTVLPPLHMFVSLPALAIIGAVAAHSYGVVRTKELIILHHYSPTFVSLSSALGGAFLALITLVIMQESISIPTPTQVVPLLLLLIIINNVIGKLWHTSLLKTHSSTLIALSEYLLPLFVAVHSFILFGDIPPHSYYITSLCIMIGLYLFKSAEHHRASIIKAGTN